MILAKENRTSGSNGEPKERPLVSYITVSYNSADSIETTIASIARCKPLFSCEHIVIDGNSDDGTEQILNRYSDSIDELVREPDHGIYDAMNKGLRLAKGKYICFINADDCVIPEAACKVAKKLRGNIRRREIVASAALAVDGNTETLWVPSALDRFLVFRCPNLCHNGVYAHRSLFERVGGFDASLKIAADSDWIIRAIRAGAKLKVLSTPTLYYSIGGASSDVGTHAREMLRIAEKSYPLLTTDIIKSLFYHLFAWQERRHLFTDHPTYGLADAIKEANGFYPELSYKRYLLNRMDRSLATKAYGKLKHSVWPGDQ